MNKIIVNALILVLILPVYGYSGQIGTAAPGFSLMDVHGKAVTLEQFKGNVVFLDFWAPWCVPCKEELPELDRLYKKFRSGGFIVIGISTDTSVSGIARFLQKVPVAFPVLVDKEGDISEAYRVSSLPVGFIITKDGVIRYRHMGFGSEFLPLYEKEIVELLKQ